MSKPRGLFVLGESDCDRIYGPQERQAIAELVEVYAPPQTPESALADGELLDSAEVIFSGWGGPLLDDAFLGRTPRLRAVFHGAGSLASIVTDAVWDRQITVSTAIAANAVPVAEYALATILFSLKHGWRFARQMRQQRSDFAADRNEVPSGYQSTVGLISAGTIGRRLIGLLRSFDLQVLVYDPFLSEPEARSIGVRLAALDEVFSVSDVVSVHTPQLPETKGIIDGRLLESMKRGATFINTARGGLVNEGQLIEVAGRRSDLQFILDVTDPEPPEEMSPLYTLENVVLTPHIAGSAGNECRRLGRCMVEELGRYVRGETLKWAVTADSLRNTSHIPWWKAPSRMKPKSPVTIGSAVRKAGKEVSI